MEDRPITISVTAGSVLKIVLILAGLWLVFTLRNIVLDVVAAVVIASAIEPGIAALMRRKIPRILSVIIIYLLIFGTFFGLFYFFFPSVLEDFASFATSLPVYLEAFGRSSAFDTYANILGVPTSSALSAGDIMTSIRSSLDIDGTMGNAFGAFARIFGGVFSFVLIIVFSFYFAVIETGVDDFLRLIAPKKHQSYILDLWRRSQQKIGLWMQGQLILGVIIGVLVYLGLTIIGVKHALFLAVIAALFEIIPVFGPILAAVPAVLIGFADGGVAMGMLVVALYVILQQFENHLIYPLVVTRVVGVPPLLIILALIIGFELAGFLGVILSVPVAATLQELARDIESGRLRKQFES